MQDITKKEAAWIREHLPDAYIVITGKRKAGRSKHYAVEATQAVRYWLEKYRQTKDITVYTREPM